MKNQSTKSHKPAKWFKDLAALCCSAAAALGISEGEFWVWYGSPFILQYDFRK